MCEDLVVGKVAMCCVIMEVVVDLIYEKVTYAR